MSRTEGTATTNIDSLGRLLGQELRNPTVAEKGARGQHMSAAGV